MRESKQEEWASRDFESQAQALGIRNAVRFGSYSLEEGDTGRRRQSPQNSPSPQQPTPTGG